MREWYSHVFSSKIEGENKRKIDEKIKRHNGMPFYSLKIRKDKRLKTQSKVKALALFIGNDKILINDGKQAPDSPVRKAPPKNVQPGLFRRFLICKLELNKALALF